MKTKIENRVIEIQTSFWVMGPTIFELWVMETQNPNIPLFLSAYLVFTFFFGGGGYYL